MSPSTAASPARFIEDPERRQGFDAPRSIAQRIRANGSVCFRVQGGSMFPWLRAGDVVFARLCALEQARAGQVVLFERDARLFVHRVLQHTTENSAGIARPLLITKGDALDGPDAPVSSSEFLGRVIRLNRNRRHIDLESFAQTLHGRLLAQVSLRSYLIYRPLRFIKKLLFGSPSTVSRIQTS